jgi:hypothetical protein
MVTPRPRAFSAPDVEYDEHATFGDALELLGYDLVLPERRGAARDRLELTLWWRAAATPAQDFKRFVHLYDPASEQVAAQDDAMPRDWTYPTTLWVAGEVVSETIAFDLTGVAPGAYRIGLGWYDPETLDRLPATADQAVVQADRVTLAPSITVAP